MLYHLKKSESSTKKTSHFKYNIEWNTFYSLWISVMKIENDIKT